MNGIFIDGGNQFFILCSVFDFAKDPDFPNEYATCRKTGLHQYLKAESREYSPSYFMEEYESQYKKTYYQDEQNLRILAQRRLSMLQKFQRPEGNRLLEIGCAAGFFLDEARKIGYETSGIEISDTEAEYARSELGLDVFSGSVWDWKPKGNYDAVCAFFVIEHFSEVEKVWDFLASKVRLGGFLFLGLPSLFGPSFQTNPSQWFGTHPKDHFYDYSPSILKNVLKLYGFELVYKKPMSFHPERDKGWKGKILTKSLFNLYANLACYGDTIHIIAKRTNEI